MHARRMSLSVLAASLAAASLALGDAATRPAATSPSTKVAATKVAATKPTTARSTTTRATAGKFPTPAELFKQMAAAKASVEAKTQVAMFDLGGPFPERADGGFNPFTGAGGETFRSLIERIQKARDDDKVRAVLIMMNEGTGMNLAEVQEIRTEIEGLRKKQKRVFVYGDAYDTQSYLLACAATDVCILGAGDLFLPGVSLESMFFKGVLDKVGVTADYVQVGEFKGAAEPYTRDGPSPELAGELGRLTKNMMAQVVDGIAKSRNLSGEKVRGLIDEAMLPAERARQAGLVDHLVDADGLRDLMKRELGDEVNLLDGYGQAAGPSLDFSNPFSILTAMAKRPEETDLPKVAVIYAQGVIVDGEGGGGGLLGGDEPEVAGEAMRRAFRMALRDEKVKAVVVRIDSPGGSASASEVMWQAMRRVAAEKPVVVSIGNMAASGGYYLASAADTIYADPAGIVGSIGVVGGKIALGGLYEKLGINVATFSAGKNADLYSSTTPWTDAQRRMIRNAMSTTYDQFTDRIKTTRGGKIADIDKVARGRIFTAAEAQTLGMVDHLGGLGDAIGEAARRAQLGDGAYDLKSLPPPPTIQEILAGRSSGGASMLSPASAEATAVLRMLPGEVRTALSQSIRMGQLLQRRPVVLMTPYVLRVR